MFGCRWWTREERTGHSSTLLPDGRVILIGGDKDNTSEIYNPVTNTSEKGPELPVPFHHHSACYF
jgi:Kelch motif